MSTEGFSVSEICREAAVMVRRNLLAIVIACIPLIIVHSIFAFMYPEMTGKIKRTFKKAMSQDFISSQLFCTHLLPLWRLCVCIEFI